MNENIKGDFSTWIELGVDDKAFIPLQRLADQAEAMAKKVDKQIREALTAAERTKRAEP